MLHIMGGLMVKKQEMTRVWKDEKMLPVTLMKVLPQEVVQHKTLVKDGYVALVVGVDKKKSGNFARICEYRVEETVLSTFPVGSIVSLSSLEGVETVRVVGTSKGKGFQGGMKRHNFGGGPATHGSKFHRALGSTGNRKPRRTIKGQKMAGHMGSETITLKTVPVIDLMTINGEDIVVLKGSVPGAYNDYVKLVIC